MGTITDNLSLIVQTIESTYSHIQHGGGQDRSSPDLDSSDPDLCSVTQDRGTSIENMERRKKYKTAMEKPPNKREESPTQT